ncbi:hypothetical protein GLU64_02340 [Nanohaloarchaea archaeon]|nr:hypothetical protein [Candidatus Nanohaloarchaea archaeon]
MSDKIDQVEKEDSLTGVYQFLEDKNGSLMTLRERLEVKTGAIDEKKAEKKTAYREIERICQDNVHQGQEDSDFQDLAGQTVRYDGSDIEVYGLAHGYDSLDIDFGVSSVEVPLFHDMSDEVKALVQSKVDELLDDQAQILYEQGGRRHFTSDQLANPRVDCLYDHSVLATSENNIQGYSRKEIAKIPFYKAVSNLPYQFAGSKLGNRQIVEDARRYADSQQKLDELIEARPHVKFQEEYLDEFNPALHDILCERSKHMAYKAKNKAESDGVDQVALFVGEGHVNQITDYIRDDMNLSD